MENSPGVWEAAPTACAVVICFASCIGSINGLECEHRRKVCSVSGDVMLSRTGDATAVNVYVQGDRATGQRCFGDGRTPVDRHCSNPSALLGSALLMPAKNAPCAVQGRPGARGYNTLKALFMAAEALVQAWSSDLARR